MVFTAQKMCDRSIKNDIEYLHHGCIEKKTLFVKKSGIISRKNSTKINLTDLI